MKKTVLKTVLVVAFMTGITTISNAQFSIGGKIGMNLANIKGKDKPDDIKMRMTMNFGAVANYSLTDLFSLQAEINYEGKGFKIKDYSESGDGWTEELKNLRFPFGYLTIPILAKATFGKSTKFFVNAGPYFGFLMSAKFKGDYTFTSLTNPELNYSDSANEDMKDFYKGFDFGLVIGGGAIFPITDALDIMAEVRYNMGFSKIVDDTDPSNISNSVIGINAGVIYKLNGKSNK